MGEAAVRVSGKPALDRRLDVYKLEPEPLHTLPFISHNTINISRDILDSKY